MKTHKSSLARLLAYLCLTASAMAGFPGTAQAEVIYKTIDSDGNVVFSDVPTKEAEKVEIQTPVTFDSSVLTHQYEGAGDRTGTEEKPGKFKYTRLEITSPANDAAIRANDGSFEITYAIEPAALSEHIVQLMMDGKVHSRVQQSGTARFVNADRGTHVFQLRVLQKSNKKVLETSPVSSVNILRYIPPRPVHLPARR